MLRIELPPAATSHGVFERQAIPSGNAEPSEDSAQEAHVSHAAPAAAAPTVRAMVLPVPFKPAASGLTLGLPEGVAAFIDDYDNGQEDDSAGWLEVVKKRLRVALKGYGLDAEIVGDRLTPNAALIRLKGSDKMTVTEVEKRRSVLLTSHSLDVIGVRPEKGEVVVTVAREARAILDLRQAWRSRAFLTEAPDRNTSFVLGERENDGGLLYLNLGAPFAGQPQHGPHTLIAGETGGGKGVLTRNLILDICATNSPANARIRLIDPKSGGDYPWIEMMPHVDGGLVGDQAGAIAVLKELTETMETRYSRITPVASNIDRYNEKVSPGDRLPRIYAFHDELGDWMADKDHEEYRAAVESYVVRLASKARAAGIHLFLITQRPDKDALPGQIKANMNNKICLRVSSQVNSRIVLDESGAENLLGHGHFAAKLANEKPSNQSNLIFGQVPFLDEDDARELAQRIAAHWR